MVASPTRTARPKLRYEPRGAMASFWWDAIPARYEEVLVEGPRNTGKSYGILHWLHQLCKETEGQLRILIVRQTLTSLRESVQVTYHNRVLEHEEPALKRYMLKGPAATHRVAYDYPLGAHIALGGMDDGAKFLSSEWDVVWAEEAIQMRRSQVDKLVGCIRWGTLPYQPLIFSTNPGPPYHWLNQRFPAKGVREAPDVTEYGDRLRLLSRHEDNPAITPTSIRKLQSLQGAIYRQHYLGEWCGEAGLVWPTYDPGTHDLDYELVNDAGVWKLRDRDRTQPGFDIILKWFACSFDYGFRVGCLAVWGFDTKGNAYLVAEHYRTGWHRPEWARALSDEHERFRFRLILADAPDNRFIDDFNADLGKRWGTGIGSIMRRPDKTKGSIFRGVQSVRYALANERLRFLDWAQRRRGLPDQKLHDAGAPESTTAEIVAYVFPDSEAATTETQRIKREKSEVPDESSVDHGCDTLRYLCDWAYGDSRPDLTVPPGAAPVDDGKGVPPGYMVAAKGRTRRRG